jgi:hypothetical protein
MNHELNITTTVYRVPPSHLQPFRITLLMGMLEKKEMPFRCVSKTTPFRAFHIDTILSGTMNKYEGFVVVTLIKGTNNEPSHVDEMREVEKVHEEDERSILDILIRTFNLELLK